MVFALAGNPNCGKTTLFNALTGSSQYVGNWPGVTVEKKEGKLKMKGRQPVTITDLPGIYSLSPYTLEEVVARRYLLEDHPNVIINIVDATNIERNLYLTTQLLETGIPVVVALNMMDLVRKNGDKIDVTKLSQALGCPIVEISALKESNIDALLDDAFRAAAERQAQEVHHDFNPEVEASLSEIESIIADKVPAFSKRWYAIKLYENDEKIDEELKLTAAEKEHVSEIIESSENYFDDDTESIITNERYEFIHHLMKSAVKKHVTGMTPSDKIDRIVTNRVLAIPIFIGIMVFVYWIAVSWIGTIVTDWMNDELFGTYVTDWASNGLAAIDAPDWLNSLIVDGIIGGVGAVLGFVPQMLILFFLLSILEDCGYMARVAFIMDRVFRKFGLSGRSFIPYMVASGCGIPGIMATRTIENENDRRMTIMTTTFIPCGAKLPMIALIAGAIFGPDAWWVAPLAYFIGIGAVIISGLILKKTRAFAGDPAPFVMELPPYRVPGLKGVLIHMWERTRGFIVKAGTIIFAASVVVWFLGNFSWSMQMVDMNDSMLANIGTVIAPVFAPLGFGNWQASVSTISGLIAKENVVMTLGEVYGLGEVTEESGVMLSAFAAAFTTVSALSYLIFNLLCAPCFAAIGAMRREFNSAKWTWMAIGYQTLLAYVFAFIVYQLGSVFALGAPVGAGTIIAFVLIGVIIWLLARQYKPQMGRTIRAVEANQ